nr:type II toxin-antitoxin system RelE/ParE family toxin [Pantoea stewartii]
MSLRDIESYKSLTIGKQQAATFVDHLLMESVEKIMEDTERYHFNVLLSERGLMLRERLDLDGEFRVIYDFDGKNVEILLFVSMKQNFLNQLYRYNILK